MANARAANAVSAAQAAAKSDYAARNAALNREAATLKRQSQAIAAEIGEVRGQHHPRRWHVRRRPRYQAGHLAHRRQRQRQRWSVRVTP